MLPRNSALKRCSRVETPQHRVLENTLNMGSILHGLKQFYVQAGNNTRNRPHIDQLVALRVGLRRWTVVIN